MNDDTRPAFTYRGDWQAQVVATAIHTGHDLRDEVAGLMVLAEDDRFREEDPFTDALGSHVPDAVVVNRSRFEVDLNRDPKDAVYATPEQSWGMTVWQDETLPDDVVARSLEEHEAFYAELGRRLDEVARRGPFLLLDVHSYNHRRGDGHTAEPQEDNPDVNVGTGSLDRERWAPLVDAFTETLAAQVVGGGHPDVRENVKFKGAELARWVHARYPGVGCALAIEFKKTFMDEWTGEPDHARIAELAAALGAAARRCAEVLAAGEAPLDPAGEPSRPRVTLSTGDLAADLAMSQVSGSYNFITLLSPANADDARRAFLADGRPPVFEYPEITVDLDAVGAQLDGIDVGSVEDATVRQLLGHKHRELGLQLEMLKARGSADFLPLSIELFGNISPRLRERAEQILAWVPDQEPEAGRVDAAGLLALAQAEVEHYRGIDSSLVMHAEPAPDAPGVMVQGDTLLVPPTTSVDARRADALIQHEVGTHLVTRANGTAQPLKILGSGLAGYDETQEGLAVLAEIASGGLTAARLRTLAARVVTVHAMVEGADIRACFESLVAAGFPRGSAFTTVMRVFRSGGFTKDLVYLRGLTDLLDHVAAGGALDLFWLGKFSLADLPLIQDLWDRGVLAEPRVCPRYLSDPQAQQRIHAAAHAPALTDILQKGPAA